MIAMFSLENIKTITSTLSSKSLNTKETVSASTSTSATSLVSNESKSDLKNLDKLDNPDLDRKPTSSSEDRNNSFERKKSILFSKNMDNDYNVNFMEEFESSESFSESITDISNLSITEIKQRVASSDNESKLYPDDIIHEIYKLRMKLTEMKKDKIAFNGKQKKQEKQILKLVMKISSMKEALQIKNFQIRKHINKQEDLETLISALQREINELAIHFEAKSQSHKDEIISYQKQINEYEQKSADMILELKQNSTRRLEFLRKQLPSKSQYAKYTKISRNRKKGQRVMLASILRMLTVTIFVVFIILFFFIVIFKKRIPPKIMSSLCAPTPPGIILTSSHSSKFDLEFISPWWVPPIIKPLVFELICDFQNSDNKVRPRIQLDWIENNDRNTLVISTLESNEFSKKPKKQVSLKKNAKSVIVHSDTIEIYTKSQNKGQPIILDAPWKLDN